ncbi:SCO6880 family protein [Sporichthya polymorpha]|uniref:SCO6880 family protein n=1 Tax=Sporichthya polymorpha TaxID=35751 RepID=UPI000376291D|nr:SCO6880 family protein [Sporichthya polymorpha]
METSTAPTTPLRYGGWQRERCGFLFGMSGARFALVALGLLCLIAPISTRSLGVMLVTWPTAAVLAGLVWLRVAGRTATEWAGLGLAHTWNTARRQNLFFSGAFAPRDPADPTAPAPMDLPGPLAALRFLEADARGLLAGTAGPAEAIAVVHHPLEETYTAIARIRYPGIALADGTRRETRIAAWGGLLAQLCSDASPFVRIAIVQRTVPDDGTALRAWHASALRADAPAAAVEAVTTLLEHSAATGAQHEAWLVLTLDRARARGQIRAAGGGDAGALAVLTRQLAAVTPAVGGAQLEITHWLGVRELAAVVRTAFDPSAVGPLAGRSSLVEGALAPGLDPRLAGPAAADARWSYYRHDSGFSVTFEVLNWPRAGVPAWFLRPILTAHHTARRSVALVVEPIGARRAEQTVMRARTRRSVAVGLRHKTGQLVPEHERQALAEAEDQDRLRAAGHGLVRFVAYLTVTVTDGAALDLACSELETDAGQCGLDVRRMWGAQDIGFYAGALPLGLGLPKMRSWA